MKSKLFAIAALAALALNAHAQPVKLTFQSNWRAQAEHGGYYQAIATGIYAKHGLDVTVRPGGPPARSTSAWARTASTG
jgi:NitT/TauT family transport system substrate-binding protein